jgi:hypothetical protein
LHGRGLPRRVFTTDQSTTDFPDDRILGVLTAIEMVRTIPTNRAVFVHAKIVHAMAGTVDIETAQGTSVLLPGMSLALGSGRWCRIKPQPRVRLWTVYIEEDLLRRCMARFLPDPDRVRAGLHPRDWDGRPIVMSPGLPVLHRVEPIWRQLSVLRDGDLAPEVVAVRSIELFARWCLLSN